MSGFYIGVDGKARKVKGGYIGVDGKARKIKKGYIGDENGVARLCWSGIEPVFANNTWEQIAAACQTRQVPDTWNIGDQKTMTIGGVDYTIDIIGKNHDDYSDGSGKAPLTFQLHECFVNKYEMNTSHTNMGGWGSSIMRIFHFPQNIMPLLPNEVQTALREVNKLTSEGNLSRTIVTSKDKLFLLSEVEVTNGTTTAFSGEGKQYEYYANGNSQVKQVVTGGNFSWWLRSPSRHGSDWFALIGTLGSSSSQAAAVEKYGVSFAFCF
jgi:hypothetical protein